jgi:hypothetical protein
VRMGGCAPAKAWLQTTTKVGEAELARLLPVGGGRADGHGGQRPRRWVAGGAVGGGGYAGAGL